MLIAYFPMLANIVTSIYLRVPRWHIVVGLNSITAMRSIISTGMPSWYSLMSSLLILLSVGHVPIVAILAIAIIAKSVHSAMPLLPEVVINLHFESPVALF